MAIEDGWELKHDVDLEVLRDVYSAEYEINNCIRGVYTGCTTYKELGEYLKSLAERLSSLGDDVSSMSEPKEEETVTAIYMENDHIVENDSVKKSEVIDWFKDSYDFHTDEKPNEDEIKCFLRGTPVIVTAGNLIMEWKLR